MLKKQKKILPRKLPAALPAHLPAERGARARSSSFSSRLPLGALDSLVYSMLVGYNGVE